MIARCLVALTLIFATAAPAFSQAPSPARRISGATPAPDDRARQWLILVDDKNYSQSWSESGAAFKAKLKNDAWASDAATRRGKPSVHKAYGERIAVLAGDALIVLAFHTLTQGAAAAPQRLAPLLMTIGRSVGLPFGIVAGQAWECEARVALEEYHRAKTGSLFVAAAVAGAVAAGQQPQAWRTLGESLGEAYQVADDIRDVADDPALLGKPVGQDEMHGRPSAVRELGMAGAVARFHELMDGAIESIPVCPGQQQLAGLIRLEAKRLVPQGIVRAAA